MQYEKKSFTVPMSGDKAVQWPKCEKTEGCKLFNGHPGDCNVKGKPCAS